MGAEWPLTGRSEQLEALGRAYREGAVGGVLLHGPAGVGKTRLAEEAVGSAERSGREVARAVGHPTTATIPLGALAHVLPGEIMSELGVGDDERTGLFHAARAALRTLAGDDRLVLLVDDLDLLDDTSVSVLVPLVVSRTVFLIGTLRTGRAPSPRLTGLQRDGHLSRLDLAPLAPDELGALLHRALDRPVSTAALNELARLSGGNLQVLTELVRGAMERGVLVEVAGAWHLTGELPTTVALDELVAEHLAGVEPAGRAALEMLAVCERFGLEDLEQLYGLPTLEKLEQDGLVSVVTAGRRTTLRLAHPLYGEVLRAGIAPLRLRSIQRQLADVIEQHGARRREDVVQVALWRVASGGRVPDEHLLRAARLTLAGHQPTLALRLISASREPEALTFERAELVAEAHAMRGEHDEVERVISGALERPLSDAQRAQLARRLATTRFAARRDLDGAMAALAAARAHVAEPDEVVAIEVHRVALLAEAGRPAEALEAADSIGEPVPSRTRVELASARAISLLCLGRYGEAIAISRRAAADHSDLPGWKARRGIAAHLLNEAHALAYSGRYREARQLLQPAAERALASNAIGAWVWFEMALGEIARDTGRGRETIGRFQAAADAAPAAGQQAALIWAHVGVAQGHLLLGECEPAAQALERAREVGESPVATSFATLERTKAWLDACRGDLAAARARIRATIHSVRRDQVLIFESALLHDLVRLGVPEEAIEHLSRLARVVEGPLIQILLEHAIAVADRDASRLEDVVSRYEQLDILGLAAEAAAELADCYKVQSDARRAAAALVRSGKLSERAGGVRTPVLARGTGIEPLTGREREVALLAAAGRSSRTIGTHLHLSTRTVDTHLARVYRKLGISGRSELASALGAAGDTYEQDVAPRP